MSDIFVALLFFHSRSWWLSLEPQWSLLFSPLYSPHTQPDVEQSRFQSRQTGCSDISNQHCSKSQRGCLLSEARCFFLSIPQGAEVCCKLMVLGCQSCITQNDLETLIDRLVWESLHLLLSPTSKTMRCHLVILMQLTRSSSSGRSPPSLMPRFIDINRSTVGLSLTLWLCRLVFNIMIANDST